MLAQIPTTSKSQRSRAVCGSGRLHGGYTQNFSREWHKDNEGSTKRPCGDARPADHNARCLPDLPVHHDSPRATCLHGPQPPQQRAPQHQLGGICLPTTRHRQPVPCAPLRALGREGTLNRWSWSRSRVRIRASNVLAPLESVQLNTGYSTYGKYISSLLVHAPHIAHDGRSRSRTRTSVRIAQSPIAHLAVGGHDARCRLRSLTQDPERVPIPYNYHTFLV